MSAQTQWLPGVIALGAGLAVAVVFMLLQRGKAAPSPAATTDALEDKYQALLRQLKEHAASKHLSSPEAWAAEQGRLEQAAAQVLRDRAGAKHEALKAEARASRLAEAPRGVLGKHPALAGALWGAGGVAFFVFLGFALTQETTARKEDGLGPSQVVAPTPGASEAPPADPELVAAMERAERSPDDVEVLADAAHELIKRQYFEDAQPLVARATMVDPYHVRTRVYREVLKAIAAPSDQAVAGLEHLADTFDDAYEARLFAGALAAQANQPARALRQFERYVAEAPDGEVPPMLPQGIAQLRAQVASGGAATPPRP